MADDEDEEVMEAAPTWEVVKENVAPLKRGRDTLKIAKVFGESQKSKVEEEEVEERVKKRSEFEAELVAEDDALEVWVRYVRWLDEAYPLDRLEGFLGRERCARKLRDREACRQDSRYVRMWLEYIDGLESPLEAFNFMEQQGIGLRSCDFWTSRANAAERFQRPNLALKILDKGIAAKVEPQDVLPKKRDHLLARIARLREGRELLDDGSDDGPPPRRPLANVRNARRALGERPTAAPAPPGNTAMPFALFVDEDLRQDAESPSLGDPQRGDSPDDDTDDDWPDFGTAASRIKENMLPASKWTQSKIGKRKLVTLKKLASDDVPPIFDDSQALP